MRDILYNDNKVYLAIKKEDIKKVESILEDNNIDFEGFWDNHKEIFFDENSKEIMKEYNIPDDKKESINTKLYDIHEYLFDKSINDFIKRNIERILNKE